MKTQLIHSTQRSGAWISVLTALSFLVPAASYAQYNRPGSTVGQEPVYVGQEPTYLTVEPVYYDTVPGIAQPIPDAFETIGMRQEKANHVTRQGYVALVHPGMSPAWFGIASALDTMAAMSTPDKILAANTIAPSIRSTNYQDRHALLAYQMRIQASENALDVMAARSVQFSGDTQTEYRSAMRELRARRAELDRQITTSQEASPDTWNQSQADLADAYSRYAEAAARVQQLTTS